MYWASRRVKECRNLPFSEATQRAASTALDVAASKVARLASGYPDYFPLYTDQGRWKHGKESWTNWCEGFLGGQMWLFYEFGLGEEWRTRAEHYSKLVEERQYDDQVHDLGFVLCPTWKKWWELTGEDARRQVVIQGGKTMATRFNTKGKFLRSFLAPDSNFIDIMMNVGIIAVAGLEMDDQHLLDVAEQHCETTRKYLVRGDGSISHEGIFDLDTGEFLRQTSQQGWRNDSSWARGLAWSLYGFTSMYALTGNPHWLATAQLNAEYWLEHTNGPDPVPPNDFDQPDPVRRWESSAAACAAGGLIMLSSLVADDDQAQRYHERAETTITRLCEPEFVAYKDNWEGVLKHGSYHETKQLGVDESVMWGEYFFTETLTRVVKRNDRNDQQAAA
jgi:unsaturated chondroitin disaccharide hydrolase